jgi:serine-protein kinase ATM
MPEMIPFRLTRDIVDGMGVSGTAGVFSRCCEETLHVLRENRQALLAVVDVSFKRFAVLARGLLVAVVMT